MERLESQEPPCCLHWGRNTPRLLVKTHFPQFGSGSAGLVLLWALGGGKGAQVLLQESSAPPGLKQAFPFTDGGDTDPWL